MENEFDPIPTVESWQISNPPVLPMASLRGALEIIDLAGGMTALRAKSERQIQFLDALLDAVLSDRVESITPRELDRRGCQFSLRIIAPDHAGQEVSSLLADAGVGHDWRYPDVIRVAPVPLYNSFTDAWRLVQILDGILS